MDGCSNVPQRKVTRTLPLLLDVTFMDQVTPRFQISRVFHVVMPILLHQIIRWYPWHKPCRKCQRTRASGTEV